MGFAESGAPPPTPFSSNPFEIAGGKEYCETATGYGRPPAMNRHL
jgi:hypothetical protein